MFPLFVVFTGEGEQDQFAEDMVPPEVRAELQLKNQLSTAAFMMDDASQFILEGRKGRLKKVLLEANEQLLGVRGDLSKTVFGRRLLNFSTGCSCVSASLHHRTRS